jgi:hypothetical protein
MHTHARERHRPAKGHLTNRVRAHFQGKPAQCRRVVETRLAILFARQKIGIPGV